MAASLFGPGPETLSPHLETGESSQRGPTVPSEFQAVHGSVIRGLE